MNVEPTHSAEQIRQAAHDWRTLLASNQATAAERAQFERWRRADPLHEDAYDRAVTVFSALGELGTDALAKRHFKPLLRERLLAAWRGAFVRRKERLAIGGALVAACVAIGVVTLPQSNTVPTQQTAVSVSYETGRNETRSFLLSDGSRVTLGAGSALETGFSSDARRVTLLSGAALFDVVSDAGRPFSVSAGDLTATALGTSFDVRRSAGIARVAVSEGTVGVSYPLVVDGEAFSMDKRLKLTPGLQVAASMVTGLTAVTPIDISEVGAWREKRLVYSRATIAELVADANRYDPRDIRIAEGSEDIAGLRLTGSFSGDNIDRMLSILQDVHPIVVEKNRDGSIALRRR
ncbi:MAG: FecR domain-containing protein [Pseudomonadota bacterium]